MPVSVQTCLALLDELPVLAVVKRELRRSGTRSTTTAMTALAVLATSSADRTDCAPGTAEPSASMRLTGLAERLQVDPSVASRQVSHLIKLGAVERVADEHDGRVHRLRVTAAGHQRLSEARQRAAQLIAEQLAGWREPDLSTLVDLLGRLRSELSADHLSPHPHDFGASPS